MLSTQFFSTFPIVLFFIFTASCSSLSSINKSVSTDLLMGEWVHSHEESTTKENVFRPHNYNFPPSRGREKMMLKEGGVLLYSSILPNDQPIQLKGTWLLSGKKLMLNYNKKKLKYTIVDISTSILKLK